MPKYQPLFPPPETIPLRIVLRMLRIAIGYGSRTEKLQRMTHSNDPDVALTARSLAVRGYLKIDEGTIDLSPK